jgi:hypothetical protein
MAWGNGKRQGNEEQTTVALTLPIPPGPSRWAAQHHCTGGRVPKSHPRSRGLFRARRPENRVANSHQYRQHRDVDRFECSSGSVRSLNATKNAVALRLLTLPGERATPTGHNPCAEILGHLGAELIREEGFAAFENEVAERLCRGRQCFGMGFDHMPAAHDR